MSYLHHCHQEPQQLSDRSGTGLFHGWNQHTALFQHASRTCFACALSGPSAKIGPLVETLEGQVPVWHSKNRGRSCTFCTSHGNKWPLQTSIIILWDSHDAQTSQYDILTSMSCGLYSTAGLSPSASNSSTSMWTDMASSEMEIHIDKQHFLLSATRRQVWHNTTYLNVAAHKVAPVSCEGCVYLPVSQGVGAVLFQ